jgi:hypothetical protein
VFVHRSSWSCGCLCTKVHSEWIGGSWIESAGGFRCWNLRLSPIAEFHRSILVWVLLCIGGVCFLLIVLIFFRIVNAFVSLFGWAVFFWFWCASLHFCGVDQHCTVGQVWLYRVNVICMDLLWFILILHFFAQSSTLLMVAWSFSDAISESSCLGKIAVSSAEVLLAYRECGNIRSLN